MYMKFLVISDLHGKKSTLEWVNPLIVKENVDCTLFLGDAVEWPCAAQESADMISLIECKRILAIPGNIDSPGVLDILDNVAENMHGKGKQVGDLYIAGLGGSNPTIFNTPFELQEEEIFAKLDPVSKEGMVLMVHAPAYGFNDVIPSGISVGSKAILDIVKKYRPKVVLSGHIHESFGRKEADGTVFINPGALKDGRCAIVEIVGDSVESKLIGPLD